MNEPDCPNRLSRDHYGTDVDSAGAETMVVAHLDLDGRYHITDTVIVDAAVELTQEQP